MCRGTAGPANADIHLTENTDTHTCRKVNRQIQNCLIHAGENQIICVFLVFKEKQFGCKKTQRGNLLTKAPIFFALCSFWSFWAWSDRASEVLLTQWWHLSRVLSNCLFPTISYCFPLVPPFRPFLIFLPMICFLTQADVLSLPHAHKISEPVKVTTTLKTSLKR